MLPNWRPSGTGASSKWRSPTRSLGCTISQTTGRSRHSWPPRPEPDDNGQHRVVAHRCRKLGLKGIRFFHQLLLFELRGVAESDVQRRIGRPGPERKRDAQRRGLRAANGSHGQFRFLQIHRLGPRRDLQHQDLKRTQPNGADVACPKAGAIRLQQPVAIGKVRDDLHRLAGRQVQADVGVEAEPRLAGGKMGVVEEHECAAALPVRVAVDLVPQRIAENIQAMAEHRLARPRQRRNPGQEIHVGIVESVQVAPEVREEQPATAEVHHHRLAPPLLAHVVSAAIVGQPHAQAVLHQRRQGGGELRSLV